MENDLCRKECVRKADFEDEFEQEYGSAFFKILNIDRGQRFWNEYWRQKLHWLPLTACIKNIIIE